MLLEDKPIKYQIQLYTVHRHGLYAHGQISGGSSFELQKRRVRMENMQENCKYLTEVSFFVMFSSGLSLNKRVVVVFLE